jgi:hypothetical protein
VGDVVKSEVVAAECGVEPLDIVDEEFSVFDMAFCLSSPRKTEATLALYVGKITGREGIDQCQNRSRRTASISVY